MAYHKRRIQPAPNKNAAKVRRRESLEKSDILVENLNPFIDRLSIQLDFYDANGNHLEQRPQSFGPKDHVELQFNCLGPCGDGQINIEPKIQEMIRKRETISEGRAKCSQVLYAGSSDVCGHELRCRTEITYRAG